MQAATRGLLTERAGLETAARRSPALLPSDQRAEWELLVRARPNLLLVGSSSATNALLAPLTPHLRQPILQYEPNPGAPVPQPLEGTLVLMEVARLDPNQQAQILRWLNQFNARTAVQVVSITSEPLFSLVEAGAFLRNLYYRLNIVRIDLAPSVDSPR